MGPIEIARNEERITAEFVLHVPGRGSIPFDDVSYGIRKPLCPEGADRSGEVQIVIIGEIVDLGFVIECVR